VLWAEHVTTNTARDRDDVLDEVRPHFNDAELVELTAISGLFNVSNRVHDTLQLPIEHSGEVNKIKTSVLVNTDKLKAYYESLVSMWPDDFPATEADPDQSAEAAKGTMSKGRLDEVLLPGAAERIRAKGPIVSLSGPESAQGEAASYFRLVSRLYRRIPASLRAWAHIPLIGRSYIPLRIALLHEGLGGVVSSRIKMMAVIKTSLVNGSAYCLAENTPLARAAGITDEVALVIASDGYMASPLLTPSERAAILWAEQIAVNTARSEEDGFAELKKRFSTTAIMELTGLCGYYNMFNRMHDSLRLPPGEDDEAEAVEFVIRVDPENIKAYLKEAVDNWPEAFPEPN
jgi:alkylhydroperoxidase family enzyme